MDASQADSHSVCDFPDDGSLCERCGYPLFGLSIEHDCPECGLAVAESSPDRRDLPVTETLAFLDFWHLAWRLLTRPRETFRRLDVSMRGTASSTFLFWTTFLAGFLWLAVNLGGWVLMGGGAASANLAYEGMFHFVAVLIVIQVLTHIEMLGVAAFSRRRGWRVPFRLAERVCGYASVAWLPGVLFAAVGLQLLQAFAFGEPWFERMIGLVRVSWVFFAGLFVLSLLWFETLVWVGVRQVKYANAWPNRRGRPTQAPDAQAASSPTGPQ